jgi:peptidyl-prolyl cis-trans isomerase A (cyclophilin A)
MNPSLPALALCAILLAPALTSAQAPAAPHKPATAHRSTAAARPSLLNPASLTAKAPAEFKAAFTTTAGNFVISVHRDWAPLGADRFYNLVRRGFFTNASFFRVVPGFVVQFGLNANPAINHAWADAKFADDPVKQSNKRGTLVFATAGPNTRTTQLFINFGDNARLDGMGFAPFGEITEGMDIVDKINSSYGEQPQQDQITDQGDAYISKNFPNIDKIKLARIVPPVPAAPAKTPAKTPAKPAAAKSKPPASH